MHGLFNVCLKSVNAHSAPYSKKIKPCQTIISWLQEHHEKVLHIHHAWITIGVVYISSQEWPSHNVTV